MSPNLESPVQTQLTVSVLNQSLSSDCHGITNSEGKPAGRRRVFVQTETGCVLGLEVDRRDSVHTVKRRLQLALNVHVEESSLTYGDLVLKNDLSVVRNDAPLLLTRNFLHRSSSTPCLSPTANDLQQRDGSGPIEILGCSSRCLQVKQLVKDVVKAIKNGVDPIPVRNGLGGAYYFRNLIGASVAIVKPTDEEPFAPNNPKGFIGKALGQPGLKPSVRVGETGFREVAAYLLDYEHFANVPPTALVKITHSVFHVKDGVNCNIEKYPDKKHGAVSKIASFQQFIPHDFDASDHGASNFPISSVHRIGILDVRIFNTDRHAGNLLVRKLHGGVGKFGGAVELVPIDHGLCLPESLEDPYFEWIHWPQASVPFSEDELDYIAKLDPVKDSEMLRLELPMIREACLRVLVLCTIFLKEAAAFGLCLAEIGEMMSREFKRMEEEPSELELVCIEARKLVSEQEVFSAGEGSCDEDDIQFSIDSDEQYELAPPKAPPFYRTNSILGSCSNQFQKMDCLVEEEEINYEEEITVEEAVRFPLVPRQDRVFSKLSISFKGVSLNEKSQKLRANISAANYSNHGGGGGGFQSGNRRSANEQLPSSTGFINLADMVESEWVAFLEKFQELLHGAFRHRKASTGKQRQRLGTSCQF